MKDVEVSKGIVTNPHRMGGQPTIQGRRITARMVADYAADPEMIDVLVDDYDLTLHDIANARGWDRKGRPGWDESSAYAGI